MRIFDVDKAREFYVGCLGFAVDWEHRFDERAPWNADVMEVTDPFGDRLRFNEDLPKG